jgi:rhodanese-related sulfurtransferase
VLGSYAEVRRVQPDEVKSWLDAESDVVIVDVRRPEAYAARHIPGALSLSSRAIEDGTHHLPRDKEIVLY